ncbi:leucine--tRNA ligase [Candidatus Beckwithbacteria bacterium CG10_big_fil_rev_8_21_14_0_10_34_10]|uniref:Leucine--tRNA ligase n=1 Tax=Candidatus Beckwithbacteria bacterium CG10_big_fil_rev_8_21_14_0_10_34_10 TaxID=1974495 RepID=A0A2H0W7Q1_9BACT|nr:MAG: leucine--tRNA ligase [Candidatus Beckwithbacteria bacterium CG10_big_fil_rev_8_21_14_0_10_34_10]
MAKLYSPAFLEPKWQAYWQKNKTYEVDLLEASNPYFNLMMFPYPSAEGLHVGNMYAFVGSDIWGRYMRMKGWDVFQPIGLDGFGIHSENYALKVKKHPLEQAKTSEKNFYRQLSLIGNGFSWENRLETYDLDYYKWTQWIFVKLFKAGLAYRKKASVNWCPSCKTVLADEQVIKERCERCDSKVLEKSLEQWFFKITKYADKLLENLKTIDWSSKVVKSQVNWIGKSRGIIITYPVLTTKLVGEKKVFNKTSQNISCFTTRPDTNFGATFVVMAPENFKLDQITSKECKKAVSNYRAQALRKSKEERKLDKQDKTGVFTGAYCLNHLNGRPMPIYVSDFVLMDVGTGAVVGVPGHDLRDFQFAKKFSLPIIRVVVGKDKDKSKITKASQVQEEEGQMINSEFLNGMDIRKAKDKMMEYMVKKGWAKRKTQYHLRDWLISRQRYWGPPIPMIKCPKCSWVPVPEKDLPIKLPYIKDWRPKGEGRGPLYEAKDWLKVKCPSCGGKAQRETDVSDTFLDSSWYFLRYPSVNKKKVSWDKTLTKKWLPVNRYIGGAEHSVLHLLYSRFICHVFKDLGFLDFSEPFLEFRAHGLIIKDGVKMSKSKGNVVNPDKYIKEYGADSLRCYLMFLGPLLKGGDFRDTGMKGMSKFLGKVWIFVNQANLTDKESELQRRWRHQTTKRVESGLKRLKYNTSLAALMEYLNFLSKETKVSQLAVRTICLLIAPFAPHMAEEIWHNLGEAKSIHQSPWPKYEEKYLKEDKIEVVVQINGKVRDRLELSQEQAGNEEKVLSLVKEADKIKSYLKDKKIKKVVFIKGKLINLVL